MFTAPADTHPWARQGGDHVGLTTRDGRFEIVSSTFDANGSFLVTVADHLAIVHDIAACVHTPRAARDLARRADPMGKIQWTRAEKVEHVKTSRGIRVGYRFTVSRLDPLYR